MNTPTLLRIVLIAMAWALPTAALAEGGKPGFLIVAPDRGFLGNQEIQALVQDFKKDYLGALALIGRDYAGPENEYAAYATKAIQELKQAGATEIVAVPLFLSASDPLLKRVAPALPAYAGGLAVRWAPAMADDYLIGQVLLDRVAAISQQPAAERLILIGTGAMDDENQKALKTDIEKLLAYVQRYKRFREAEAVVYFDREAEGAEKKNQEIKARVLAQIAKQGRTVIVPAFIGPKFDNAMALSSWLEQQFKPLQVAYQQSELLPHANVLLWLKKTANRSVAAAPGEIGVVIMPHGSTQPWNDAVERTIAPLKAKHRIEMAYGMGDPWIIQDAVTRLEQQGVKRIVFVRMYALESHMKPLTDYILGLSDRPPSDGQGHGFDHEAVPPHQIRSAALFSTFGGYEEYAGISQVMCDRMMEVSKDPGKETVILLAHGEGTDEGNSKWLAIMNGNIERIKKDPRCARFKTIRAAAVREDWPDKRKAAVEEVRHMIEEDGKNSRVIVIANRLYGSGPYRKMLKGLQYDLNEKGLVHPVITRWLEEGIGQVGTALARPSDSFQRLAQQ
ncbi:MAG: hypothetical protein EPO61_05765 [Nitrospirae bacterium]|nr:MAG: hypothetical protein EPO61_05765 [Nitrospirota bacterium]